MPSDSSVNLLNSTELNTGPTPDLAKMNENSLSKESETEYSTQSQDQALSRAGDLSPHTARVVGQLPQNWRPGQSGNPAGRPKGTKNKITVLKQELELKLRDRAKFKIEKVLDKAFDLALEGDRMMIKLLLELHLSKQVHADDEKGGKSQVAVIVSNLTDNPMKTDVKVIEHNEHG